MNLLSQLLLPHYLHQLAQIQTSQLILSYLKKENVSASTKGKSKTTEPTTDSVNGKHSEVKSADYNSSLPQTNNKSSLAGILAGSAMIATMSTLGIAYKKKQN